MAAGSAAFAQPAHEYHADLGALNNSGVTGTADLTLDGNQLTVRIHATGLEPGEVHAQHIHGDSEHKSNATCPPPSADQDGDGVIDFQEGLPFHGPVLLALEPFSSAPGGVIDFEETYTVDPRQLGPLQNRTIVMHGLTVGGTYVPSLPIACAQIEAGGEHD
jgi:hypothetical protein